MDRKAYALTLAVLVLTLGVLLAANARPAQAGTGTDRETLRLLQRQTTALESIAASQKRLEQCR